jgi:transcriptional regulator with XRE-family HTH domain
VHDEEDHGFGKRLRAARNAAGLTQKQLGELSGKGRSYVAQIERGDLVNPGIDTFYPIATALGVRIEDLMGVPRIERLTKGVSHNRAEFRRKRNSAPAPLADVQAELERRYADTGAAIYGEPINEDDWTAWTAGTDLDRAEVIEAGERYAQRWARVGVPTKTLMGGAYVCAIVAGTLRANGRSN